MKTALRSGGAAVRIWPGGEPPAKEKPRAVAGLHTMLERFVLSEAVLDALMLLQEKIQANDRKPIVVPPKQILESARSAAKESGS